MRNLGIGDPSTLITVRAPVTPVIVAQQEGAEGGEVTKQTRDLRFTSQGPYLLIVVKVLFGQSTYMRKCHGQGFCC